MEVVGEWIDIDSRQIVWLVLLKISTSFGESGGEQNVVEREVSISEKASDVSQSSASSIKFVAFYT